MYRQNFTSTLLSANVNGSVFMFTILARVNIYLVITKNIGNNFTEEY